MEKTRNNLEKQILSRVYGFGRGWSFSRKDFAQYGAAESIDKTLSRIAQKGTIRRLTRGLYDYPKFSNLLKQELGPDIDQAAHALARKFGWNIQISGNAALNLLGLSTQVPTQYLYHSDGPSKSYTIHNTEISFKKTRFTHLGAKLHQSEVLIQAFEALGDQPLSSAQRNACYQYLAPNGKISEPLKKQILKDTQFATSWVYEKIKELLMKDPTGQETQL